MAEHPKVPTVEAMEKEIGHLGGMLCKNLFLKAKKKHPKRADDSQLWLVVAKHDSKVNLKELTKELGYPSKGELRMGRDEALTGSLQVVQGEVTPFALINDPTVTVNVVLDKNLVESAEKMWFHPLSNEASLGTFKGNCGGCGVEERRGVGGDRGNGRGLERALTGGCGG